ncbi:ATV_HP_G0106020.mRNA.1.CDS.1 [Saccharomyces cerevisiae]|nr:ATV_HP_G0106020.mRNA.1.CDS.1 [Saccharomyces cerevisiae]CAI6641777.1 ATV_HP_G0106020.mRNA.1.CDS.1 [Saccharomyces cerevisiae]
MTNEEDNNNHNNNNMITKIATTQKLRFQGTKNLISILSHIHLEVPITNTVTNTSSDQGSLVIEAKGSSYGGDRRGSSNTSGSGGKRNSKHYRSKSAGPPENEKSRMNGLEKIISKTSKGWSRSPKKNTPGLEKQVLLNPTISNGGTSRRSSNNGESISTNSSKSSMGITFGNTETYKTPVDNGKDAIIPAKVKTSNRSLRAEGEQALESDKELPNGAGSIYEGAPREKTTSQGSEPVGLVSDSLQVDEQLQRYWHDTRYIMSTVAMMQHRRETHDIVKRREIARRNEIEITQDADTNIRKTADALTQYDNELNKVLKLGNDWTSKLLNDYSIRVETLISSSDTEF